MLQVKVSTISMLRLMNGLLATTADGDSHDGPQPTITADQPSNDATTSTAKEDTEMKDASSPVEAASAANDTAVAVTNGTPSASAKKASNGSARKKSVGVPEHRSKKLNRKKSKPTLHLNCTPGELYLARLKGHAPWPSIIADEDMLPTTILKTRPVTTALPDGTFRRPEYADGGKRAFERTYPIMFL
jgi:hypothetical protein